MTVDMSVAASLPDTILLLDQEVDTVRGDVDTLAGLVLRIKDARAQLDLVYAAAQQALLDAMDGDVQVVRDGYRFEPRMSVPRKTWQHRDLGAEVARRIMQHSVDMETGEVLKSPEEMIVELLDYAAPSYWRVKDLARIGLDADDWCETGDPKLNLVITRV